MDIELHVRTVNHRVKGLRKDWGIFFTPQWVVDFMVGLIKDFPLDHLRVLEPASGVCQFLFGIKKNRPGLFNKASMRIAVEINQDMIEYITRNIPTKELEIIHNDYLLWDPDMEFNIIIGNPPYGIPSLSEH